MPLIQASVWILKPKIDQSIMIQFSAFHIVMKTRMFLKICHHIEKIIQRIDKTYDIVLKSINKHTNKNTGSRFFFMKMMTRKKRTSMQDIGCQPLSPKVIFNYQLFIKPKSKMQEQIKSFTWSQIRLQKNHSEP